MQWNPFWKSLGFRMVISEEAVSTPGDGTAAWSLSQLCGSVEFLAEEWKDSATRQFFWQMVATNSSYWSGRSLAHVIFSWWMDWKCWKDLQVISCGCPHKREVYKTLLFNGAVEWMLTNCHENILEPKKSSLRTWPAMVRVWWRINRMTSDPQRPSTVPCPRPVPRACYVQHCQGRRVLWWLCQLHQCQRVLGWNCLHQCHMDYAACLPSKMIKWKALILIPLKYFLCEIVWGGLSVRVWRSPIDMDVPIHLYSRAVSPESVRIQPKRRWKKSKSTSWYGRHICHTYPSTVIRSTHASIEAVPKLLQIMLCVGCASPCVHCGLHRRQKTDSLWGEVGMFGSDIYICYNNYVKHIYLQYIHTYIQIYYNTSCTHTFPIIIHLILLDSFQEPMSLQPVDPPLESAEPGGGGEFLWLSYRWWFQNVSNILIFYPDPWGKWSNLMKQHLSIRVDIFDSKKCWSCISLIVLEKKRWERFFWPKKFKVSGRQLVHHGWSRAS